MLGSTTIPIFRQIRASTRLGLLVLLVMVLKIGAAAACAKHDLADLGLTMSTGTSQSTGDHGPADPDKDDPQKSAAHAGVCTLCGCHQAVTVPQLEAMPLARGSHTLVEVSFTSPPNAPPSFELRPPIV